MDPFLRGVLLPTTVVGSYPVVPRKNLRSIFDPLSGAVEQAVSDQIAAGITIISDGQVRGDMISLFASKLPGIRGKEVIGRVLPPDLGITGKDTKYARGRHPYVKGLITGPTTLSHGLQIKTPAYRGREELIPDIAAALAKEAASLSSLGISILQIDEPIFSTGIADLSLGRRAIETVIHGLDIPVCLHVCGSLKGIFDEYLKMPVQILDFEGSHDPENLSLFSGSELQGRYVGYGCVNSSVPELESLETVRERIQRGIDILGPERILLDPDCGLRMHTRESAYAKLSRLAEAAAVVRADL